MKIAAFNEANLYSGSFFPMTETELVGCHGGKLSGGVWWAIASVIISNWQDIREGFSDGVSGKSPRY